MLQHVQLSLQIAILRNFFGDALVPGQLTLAHHSQLR
jgi:hypothetical protein